MAKRKKVKTQHLSDAEIWDDSALIRSWDEAVAEYEYYHSIHARGEDVEEVLRQAELEEEEEKERANAKASALTNGAHVNATSAHANLSEEDEDEDGEIKGDDDLEKSRTIAEETALPSHGSKDAAATPSVTKGNTYTHARQSDAALTGSSQVLENIKMAYWWAGYYSGLYEGQQQAANGTTTTSDQRQV